MCTREQKNDVKEAIDLISERFESPRLTSNLEKSDGLVHCSVENAAVLCKNHRESPNGMPAADMNSTAPVLCWLSCACAYDSRVCTLTHRYTNTHL